MFCDEALDAVEAIASGELKPDGRIADHFATCPNCAAALNAARTLERLLRQWPAPKAPPQFTTRTMGRVRRARWRSEQVVDFAFNAGVGVTVFALFVGVWLLFRRAGLTVVGGDAVGFLGIGLAAVAQRVGPWLPLYAAATALLVTALGIWWWAERETWNR